MGTIISVPRNVDGLCWVMFEILRNKIIGRRIISSKLITKEILKFINHCKIIGFF